MDVATNNAYPTPLANTTILPLLLLSLAQQKIAPRTCKAFQTEYDFIIVGAGSAGSVLASRLSEVPCASVLLLEAGKSPPLLTDVPGLARYFLLSDLDWKYKTVPQKHCARALVNNQVIWPSGKALGGSSILNANQYVRGNKFDYDEWARNGAVGWSYSDVLPYFLKLENNRETEYLANGYHVVGGPVTVESPGYLSDIRGPIIEAAQNLGFKILDSNANQQIGISDYQATIRGGQRCSTAKAYLVPAENRTNLDILPNAFVRKVLIENKRAVGVNFEYGGRTHTVRARKEVILSAGTTNTAQLLMLSGIGPRKHLEKFKIPVIADLPVGDNFQDHCGTNVGYQLDPCFRSFAQKAADPNTAIDYIKHRKGLLSSLEGTSVLAFINQPSKPLCITSTPDLQVYFVEVPKEILKYQLGMKPKTYEQVYLPYENVTSYHCMVQVLKPKSRGTVRLNSNNPHDPPIINPDYFSNLDDLEKLVDGLKFCRKIGESEPMRKLGAREFSTLMPGCEHLIDDDHKYLTCKARSIIITLNNQVGTAKMGHPNDPTTVVDPRLKVKGINGLRVVDASIMPMVPSGNINIPVIMVAEKASDMIKDTLNCKTQTLFMLQN